MLLQHKVALITGAAGPNGLGYATARLLAAHGAKVVILDLPAADPLAAASRLGPEHLGVAGSVVDRSTAQQAVACAMDRYGRLDVLVNNAGITQPRQTLQITPADYDAVLDVSLRGTLLCSQAAIPAMRAGGGGSIVCISSVSAQRGGGILGGPHYSAAKAGVLGLARAMAREFGPDGIRVNCVAPGLIGTDILQGRMSEEKRAEIAATIPLGRLGAADDIAGVCLFLASDLSRYCTGITLDVNGGMLIH